jgi:tripartite-type tricarboxylate transporter receptor subunit TctC
LINKKSRPAKNIGPPRGADKAGPIERSPPPGAIGRCHLEEALIMKTRNWNIGLIGLAVSAALGVAAPAQAIDLPCRAVKMIVPWKAGGDTDLVFRPVVDVINALNPVAKLQVVNIGGQSGNKGAKEAKESKPDGCTLLALHESQITTYLAGRVDFTWDVFQPVALLTYTPSVIGAHKAVPYTDVKGLVAYAKKNPGQVKVGVTTGSTSQFLNLLIEEKTGTQFKYVPYEGTRERLTALLANNVDMGEMNILTAKQYMKEGSLKALGIATEKRDPQAPEVPTLREQGIDIVYGLNRGVVLPKGAKPEVVKYYEDLFRKAMQDPKIKKLLDEHGTWIVFKDSKSYTEFLKKSYEDSERVAIKIGLYKKK